MDAMGDKIKIGVLGLGPEAGAGFISALLARAMAESKKIHPAVVEISNKSRLYDSLAIDKHFAGKKYNSFFRDVSTNKSIRGKSNILYGVNWVLKSPEESNVKLDTIKTMRLVNQVQGDVIICKISEANDEKLHDLLLDMDKILAIIDPLPSKMLGNYNVLCKLRMLDTEVIYVINKMNGGVSKRDMLNYLQIKNPVYFPMLDPIFTYGAEYSCKFLFDNNRSKSTVLKPTYDILRLVIPGIC